jgi:hypothetical protein
MWSRIGGVTDINERILTEADDRGGSLLADDFVRLVEQYHPHDRPGIAWDTLEAYTEALEGTDFGHTHEMDGFLDAVDEHLVDGDSKYTTDVLYRLDDDRVSVYPAHWHDELGGATDLREYVRFLAAIDPDGESGADLGGSGRGVPEQVLLDAAGIIGRTDPETVKSRLEDLRQQGDLVERADQHPNARIRLPENADNFRDSSIDS